MERIESEHRARIQRTIHRKLREIQAYVDLGETPGKEVSLAVAELSRLVECLLMDQQICKNPHGWFEQWFSMTGYDISGLDD